MMSCSEALQHYSVQSEHIYCGNISFCARFLGDRKYGDHSICIALWIRTCDGSWWT